MLIIWQQVEDYSPQSQQWVVTLIRTWNVPYWVGQKAGTSILAPHGGQPHRCSFHFHPSHAWTSLQPIFVFVFVFVFGIGDFTQFSMRTPTTATKLAWVKASAILSPIEDAHRCYSQSRDAWVSLQPITIMEGYSILHENIQHKASMGSLLPGYGGFHHSP